MKIKNVFRIILYPFVLLRRRYWQYLMHNNPKKWVEVLYKLSFGRPMNWNNPKEMNEKQRWIQFNSKMAQYMWPILADKYAVREYIEEKGLSTILVKLYGRWTNADDIDFSKLPNKFVLKTNHGCGEIMVVKDKSLIDQRSIKEKFNQYLHTPYGYEAGEYHYLKIKPCIIAEELLEEDSGFSTSLIDYKFYVFHGKPEACAVFFNRELGSHNVEYCLYDMDWNCIENTKLHRFDNQGPMIPRPKCLLQMIEICRILAEQIPFVRLDFYEVKGQLYFGEFTFTPSGLNSASSVYQYDRMLRWGSLMDLSKVE
ncbi:MAG: hypothetical protein IIX13_01360 [Bacteroidales bacterium]|nr:hypothetical protein [Bacteroidales bacterium]